MKRSLRNLALGLLLLASNDGCMSVGQRQQGLQKLQQAAVKVATPEYCKNGKCLGHLKCVQHVIEATKKLQELNVAKTSASATLDLTASAAGAEALAKVYCANVGIR